MNLEIIASVLSATDFKGCMYIFYKSQFQHVDFDRQMQDFVDKDSIFHHKKEICYEVISFFKLSF